MSRGLNRRDLIALAGAGIGLPAWSQGYPSKPIHLVVPFPPGGTTDYVTRLIANELAKAFPQPVIVDNRPGAGTVIGVDAVAKSPADGQTLVTVANSFAVNQTLVKALPYDSLKDLRPVALMGLSEHVLAATPGLGVRNLAELVAYSRANPGKLSYASFGNGTSPHLSGEMLKARLGLDMIHVPYKGQAPALNDLLGGQVALMFGNWPEFRGHVQSGKLVALGMATLKRSVYAPGIPTLAEQGTPIESNSWNGLLAPAATPQAVVTRLNTEVMKALHADAVSDAFQKGGIEALPGGPDRFAEFLQSEIAKYAAVIRSAHITADA
jgi:tripartite-type tricarboxylate transporter receptor subunit TctC